MPPITMTREEYKMKYGLNPVLSNSSLDTTPAPRVMTRQEYENEYGTPNVPERSRYERAMGIGSQEPGILKESVMQWKKGFQQTKESAKSGDIGGLGKGILNQTTALLRGAFSPLEAGFRIASQTPGVSNVVEGTQEKLVNPVAEKIGSSKWLQKQTQKYPDLEETVSNAITLGTTFIGAKKAPQIKSAITETPTKIKDFLESRKVNKDTTVKTKIADEIADIESNYAKLRKSNEYSKDANASRMRIAETDVLVNAVDDTGTVRTKQPGGAVEQYRKQTIDGIEDVVKKNLENLKEEINLGQVERELKLEIANSGLEGADLITALNGVKKEIAGLKLRANELGDVPLAKIHEAKINTTKNINYQTPPETATYRKAVARAYKRIVEDNSSFNVKDVNAELAKYYEDIKRLEALDGRKVKGGKLGKYSAQIAGNIAGGAVGTAVGGLPGTAVGTIVGGEVGSFIKGRSMAGTFGKERGLQAPKNPILEKASATTKETPKIDLTKPSPRVGAPKNIPKTKEIFKLENEIRKNVEMQNKAIKAGDFTLVQKLKEVYDALVSKLKEVIKRIKETPNKQGGFIKNPLSQTSKSGKPIETQLSQSPQSSSKSTTGIKESQPYKGEKDLTTKILKDLEGKTTVSKQYILDATNRGELKQIERDLIRQVLNETEEQGTRVSKVVTDKAIKLLNDKGIPVKNGDDYVTVYHGTNSKGVKGIDSSGNFQPFSYFATDPEASRMFSFGRGGKVYEAKIKVKDLGFPQDSMAGAKGVTFQSPYTLVKGKDGVIHSAMERSDTINVSDFAKKVKAELLPLKVVDKKTQVGYGVRSTRYEGISLPDNIRGRVKNYDERVYESPIKTSAGGTHFNQESTPNYFGHTRIEEMADGKTVRVIEGQTDLYQKGRLERDLADLRTKSYASDVRYSKEQLDKFEEIRVKMLKEYETKLLQYDNRTSIFRMFREEMKYWASKGKTKLQFPTGETAMKIEGLGQNTQWIAKEGGNYSGLKPDNLKVGLETYMAGQESTKWIITDVLGDGKFKAVPKDGLQRAVGDETDTMFTNTNDMLDYAEHHAKEYLDDYVETFDISGKVDTNNPIYKFYEKDVQKYLSKFGGKRIVDDKGVSWIEVPIKKEWAKMPVEAFALLAGVGLTNNE